LLFSRGRPLTGIFGSDASPSGINDLFPEMQAGLTGFKTTVDAGWNRINTNCQFASVLLLATDGEENGAASIPDYLEIDIFDLI
jgi:hypothetical protein